eukprot:GHVP01065342.1.p1 GENE.GHVP01065342.1~~GHVP01065342.1.p1  ORF type:complete len:182 (+),score=25.37 GHVP01065342.1:257-802(+)
MHQLQNIRHRIEVDFELESIEETGPCCTFFIAEDKRNLKRESPSSIFSMSNKRKLQELQVRFSFPNLTAEEENRTILFSYNKYAEKDEDQNQNFLLAFNFSAFFSDFASFYETATTVFKNPDSKSNAWRCVKKAGESDKTEGIELHRIVWCWNALRKFCYMLIFVIFVTFATTLMQYSTRF